MSSGVGEGGKLPLIILVCAPTYTHAFSVPQYRFASRNGLLIPEFSLRVCFCRSQNICGIFVCGRGAGAEMYIFVESFCTKEL